MGELLLGCSGWNYGDTPDKGEDGLEYFIQIKILSDLDIILSSSIQLRWILYFMRNSILR
jgi:hypothetical protein